MNDPIRFKVECSACDRAAFFLRNYASLMHDIKDDVPYAAGFAEEAQALADIFAEAARRRYVFSQ